MIYGNISNALQYHPFPPVLRRALQYLSATDLEALAFGVYQPDPDFSVQINNLTTQFPAETVAEVHKQKLDIHYSITGEETVYCRMEPVSLPITDDQFKEKDIGYYAEMDQEIAIPLDKGDFVILFAGEIHRPGCVKGPVPVAIKKVVVKIEMNRLG